MPPMSERERLAAATAAEHHAQPVDPGVGEWAGRCAVCGRIIQTVPQYAFGVDEETGQFHRLHDLAVCINCPSVLRPSVIAEARARRRTRPTT